MSVIGQSLHARHASGEPAPCGHLFDEFDDEDREQEPDLRTTQTAAAARIIGSQDRLDHVNFSPGVAYDPACGLGTIPGAGDFAGSSSFASHHVRPVPTLTSWLRGHRP